MGLTHSLKFLYWDWEDITVCHDNKWGYTVAQFGEALRYKPEGRGFDSRWCHWNFSLT
jgi:hypothetical protein